jgi:hypothetical protein
MSADEMTELDDPFILQNFTKVLRKIMQEDSGTWEALGLMQEGRSTGLMYMTAQMRTHFHPYGTVSVQQFWLALHCTLHEG